MKDLGTLFIVSEASKQATHIISFQFKMGEVECNAVLWWCYNFPYTIFVAGVDFWETRTYYGTIWNIKHSTTGICNMINALVVTDVPTTICYMAELRIYVWYILQWKILTYLHNACHQNEAQTQFYKNTHNLQECLHSCVHSHESV